MEKEAKKDGNRNGAPFVVRIEGARVKKKGVM